MAGHDIDYEHRIRALEATCEACKARRKRRRKVGFDTSAEGTSLANSLAVHETDRAPDEFGDPEERRR